VNPSQTFGWNLIPQNSPSDAGEVLVNRRNSQGLWDTI